jgi:hypothetical protein
MQLVPAGAGACFSAREYGRPAAPAVTASTIGSKVNLQLRPATSSFGFLEVMRGAENGPMTFLTRLRDSTRSFTDNSVRPGVMYRYQVHAIENSSDPQLPYAFVCGVPSEEIRITVPPIGPRRRAVH